MNYILIVLASLKKITFVTYLVSYILIISRLKINLILIFFIFVFTQLNAQSDTLILTKQDSVYLIQSTQNQTFIGDYIVIDVISITGNHRTKPHIIRRELDYKEGDSINVVKLDSLLKWEKNKLFNTNLFVTTNVEIVRNPTNGNVIMHVHVHEQWYTIPQVYLEFADRNINEWYYQRGADPRRLNAGIRLAQRNVRGRNETLRLTVQGGFTNAYGIGYDMPYIDKKLKWGASFSMEYSNNTSVAATAENHVLKYIKSENLELLRHFYDASFSLSYRPKFFTKHSFEAAGNYNIISDTIAKYNPEYFGNSALIQKYAYLRYTFENDTRDRRQFAHSGHLIKFDLEQLGFTIYENVHTSRATITLNAYKKLYKNSVFFATKLKLKGSVPIRQPYNEFKALGYNENWVRGFELYAIDGQHYVLNRNSIRLRLYSLVIDFKKYIPIRQFRVLPLDFYITGFGDWGYVSNTDYYFVETFRNQLLSNRLHGSVGAGLNIVSFYNSVLRFEYSYNSLQQLNFRFSMATDI
ncbi:MAG: BamA/TamA family outer membrane protein [Bacteroidota bacterium]|nr:BamA/TamA family outer membrane protein [Bacteroidota bacterium]